jgi:hypothetical protein
MMSFMQILQNFPAVAGAIAAGRPGGRLWSIQMPCQFGRMAGIQTKCQELRPGGTEFADWFCAIRRQTLMIAY